LLDQVVGVKPHAIDRVNRVELVWKAEEPEALAKRFIGFQYRQDVDIMRNDVEVLATFLDGRPAVCERQYGKGRVIWMSTFCFLAVQPGSLCPSGDAVIDGRFPVLIRKLRRLILPAEFLSGRTGPQIMR